MDVTIEMSSLRTAALVDVALGQLFYRVSTNHDLSGLCLRVTNHPKATVQNAFITLDGEKPFRIVLIRESDEGDVVLPVPMSPFYVQYLSEQPELENLYGLGGLVIAPDGPFFVVQHDQHDGNKVTKYFLRMRDWAILADPPTSACGITKWKLTTRDGSSENVWLGHLA
ncbi:hypothetical protein ACFPME_16780 [Rhodanobacter umsongensis]|uniref:Uncharacterized protein n=1 Tax=Rhodanobacter umsongensis TaxID=633153 RepID=A0ABW0JQ85_9GAMM